MSWYDTALAAWYRSKALQQEELSRGIEQAGQGIAGGIREARQNAIADQVSNALANSGAYAPRAEAVNPSQIPAGVPTAGTAPMSGGGGGMLGFQLRNAMANQGIENALKRAQIGYYGAHGAATLQNAATSEGYRRMQEAQIGQTIAQGGKAGQQAQAAALRQARVDAEKNADTVPRVYAELKDIYGDVGAKQWLQAAQSGKLTRGSIQNGKWITDSNGGLISASPTLQEPQAQEGGLFGIGTHLHEFTADDAKPNAPIDAIQPFAERLAKIKAAGGRAVPPVTMSAQPAGGGNMPTFQTPEEAAASGLPSGSPFKDPTGTVRYMP